MFNKLLLVVNGILSTVADNDPMHVSHQLADTLRAALIGLGALGLGSLWVMSADDAAGEAAPTRVLADACQALAVHQPRDDVAYRPGFDVRGNEVLAADAADGGSLTLDNVTIELKAPLGQQVPGRVTSLGGSEVVVGSVTVDVNGGLTRFEGRDIAATQRRLAEECQARRNSTVR